MGLLGKKCIYFCGIVKETAHFQHSEEKPQEPAARWHSPPSSSISVYPVTIWTPLMCNDSSSKSHINWEKPICTLEVSDISTAPTTHSAQLTTLSEAPMLSHSYEPSLDHLCKNPQAGLQRTASRGCTCAHIPSYKWEGI